MSYNEQEYVFVSDLSTFILHDIVKSVDKKSASAILDMAYEAGVNFYDTAEIYPTPPQAETFGITEEIAGEWLQTPKA